MKRERFPPDDPREWINRANSNLALARNVIADADLEDFCFDAQQAAEKGVKAIFVHRGETFPYSHDLDKLLRLLERNGVKVPKYVNEAKELTQYAHETRYPGIADPVTPREYRRAVRIATAVLRHGAERQVTARDTPPGRETIMALHPNCPVPELPRAPDRETAAASLAALASRPAPDDRRTHGPRHRRSALCVEFSAGKTPIVELVFHWVTGRR